MSTGRKSYIALYVMTAVAVVVVVIDVLWLVPKLHALRVTIDNDRASQAVIIQQQSNIEQLTRDVESIQKKETELETHVWTFLKEETFFTSIENISTATNARIDTPTIADATPTGSIIPRSVTIVIHGKLDRVLNAIASLQSASPLIAVQELSIIPDAAPGAVQATLTGATLWK